MKLRNSVKGPDGRRDLSAARLEGAHTGLPETVLLYASFPSVPSGQCSLCLSKLWWLGQ